MLPNIISFTCEEIFEEEVKICNENISCGVNSLKPDNIFLTEKIFESQIKLFISVFSFQALPSNYIIKNTNSFKKIYNRFFIFQFLNFFFKSKLKIIIH
jgi:hypothetical protein